MVAAWRSRLCGLFTPHRHIARETDRMDRAGLSRPSESRPGDPISEYHERLRPIRRRSPHSSPCVATLPFFLYTFFDRFLFLQYTFFFDRFHYPSYYRTVPSESMTLCNGATVREIQVRKALFIHAGFIYQG